jgi:hypothetical protein
MTPLEIGIVTALVLLLASQLVQVFITMKIQEISTRMIAERLEDLNVAMAEAVQNFVDNAGGAAPNPLLPILARVFENSISQQKEPVKIIPPKDEKGLFTSDS